MSETPHTHEHSHGDVKPRAHPRRARPRAHRARPRAHARRRRPRARARARTGPAGRARARPLTQVRTSGPPASGRRSPGRRLPTRSPSGRTPRPPPPARTSSCTARPAARTRRPPHRTGCRPVYRTELRLPGRARCSRQIFEFHGTRLPARLIGCRMPRSAPRRSRETTPVSAAGIPREPVVVTATAADRPERSGFWIRVRSTPPEQRADALDGDQAPDEHQHHRERPVQHGAGDRVGDPLPEQGADDRGHGERRDDGPVQVQVPSREASEEPAFNTMISSEVPIASVIGTRSTTTSAGTTRNPPPTPRNPVRSPRPPRRRGSWPPCGGGPHGRRRFGGAGDRAVGGRPAAPPVRPASSSRLSSIAAAATRVTAANTSSSTGC